MKLNSAFPFITQPGHIVCLAGGGGKTSLMFALAHAAADCGMHVLVTTTTHIGIPKDHPVVSSLAMLKEAFRDHSIVVAGFAENNHKLSQPQDFDPALYRQSADLILIEADGAKNLPCKVPNATEPVIPEEADIVIGVMGMDTPGKPLGEICFRKQETMAFLGTDADHIMTINDMAAILTDPRGTMKGAGGKKYIIVLNKCDDIRRKNLAADLRKVLAQKGFADIFCMSLKQTSDVW